MNAREAHKAYHRTRCGAWLLATGMRPERIDAVSPAKEAVRVVRVREPRPEFGCDVHPVEP